MDHSEIAKFFTRSDGSYVFARWGRPIAPVVFGVEDKTLPTIKGAIEAVVMLANHKMAEQVPELGANLLMFYFREWVELLEAPDIDKLVPDLEPLVTRLQEAQANQYRLFRFDENGAIKAAFIFVRMDEALNSVPAEELALSQAAHSILLWSEQAFSDRGPLAKAGETVILHPDVAAVIKAAYDPVMPTAARDGSHALRIAARSAQLIKN